MAGEIVHLELPSRSFERSAAFYGKVFGWRAEGAQAGGHLLFQTPGAGDGGPGSGSGMTGVRGSWVLHALAQAPGPLPFVAVEDIDATLAEVERQGGRILVPRLSLSGQGEFGLLADPDGNVIAVMVKSGGGATGSSESSTGAARPPVAPSTSADDGKAASARPAAAPRAKAAMSDKSPASQAKSATAARGTPAKTGAKAAARRKR